MLYILVLALIADLSAHTDDTPAPNLYAQPSHTLTITGDDSSPFNERFGGSSSQLSRYDPFAFAAEHHTRAVYLMDTKCQDEDEGHAPGWICNHEDTTP